MIHDKSIIYFYLFFIIVIIIPKAVGVDTHFFFVKKQNISKVKLLTKIHSTSGSQEKSFLGFLLFGIAQATFWVWKEAIWQDFPQRFVLNFLWFWLSLIISFISCYYLYLFKIVYCVFYIMLHILMENVGHTRKKTLSFHL